MDFGDSAAAAETRLPGSFEWSSLNRVAKIPSPAFYAAYHGHRLYSLVASFREDGRKIIWLAGDSSLDNKHWLFWDSENKSSDPMTDERYVADACNGYGKYLDKPRSICDVCFWINMTEEKSFDGEFVCVNTSVEASTLKDRMSGLLGPDMLIRDFMSPQGSLVFCFLPFVSVLILLSFGCCFLLFVCFCFFKFVFHQMS
jgi:hypothetical protein